MKRDHNRAIKVGSCIFFLYLLVQEFVPEVQSFLWGEKNTRILLALTCTLCEDKDLHRADPPSDFFSRFCT